MNKHAEFLRDALQWELDRGWHGPRTLMESRDALTLPDGTQVSLKGGRIDITRTAAAERALQESMEAAVRELHEQQPTSFSKADAAPRFTEDIPLFSTGLDLSQYVKYKSPQPAPKPITTPAAPTGVKTLSEAQLEEARNTLYQTVMGAAAPQFPAGLHARLAAAVRGY